MECPICLNEIDLEDTESIVKLKCLHVFHYKCIDKWFQLKKTCPVCRFLREDDDEYTFSTSIDNQHHQTQREDIRRFLSCSFCCIVCLCFENILFFLLR
jgi:hypothetical protein